MGSPHQGQHPLRKPICPNPATIDCWRWDFMSLFLIYAVILVDLIFCKSSACNLSHGEFMTRIATSCMPNAVLLKTYSISGSYKLSVSLLFGVLRLRSMIWDTDDPLRAEHSTISYSLHKDTVDLYVILYYKRKFLWLGIISALLCGYKENKIKFDIKTKYIKSFMPLLTILRSRFIFINHIIIHGEFK